MDPRGRDAGLVLLFQSSEWSLVVVSGFDPPSAVYHYTGPPGFAGIVHGGALRATNFSFLNDPSEVRFGRELAVGVLETIVETVSPNYRALVEQSLQSLHAKVISESYVSCFTELSDDLSQWRAYGGAAVTERYCIGFDASTLCSVFSTRPGGRFAKVLYQRTLQEQRIEAIVGRAIGFVQKNRIDRENWPAVASVVANVIDWYLPEFKDPAYQNEAEWRIIRWRDGLEHDSLSFETSRGVLRPFLPVPLPSPLPVISVQIMAPSRKEIATKAAEMLLRKANVSHVEVRHSSIPFAE